MQRPCLPQRVMACPEPPSRGAFLWSIALLLGALSGAALAELTALPRPAGRTAPISAQGAVGAPLPGVTA